MNPIEGEEALRIRDLVRQLAILHGDPERFHVLKDEAARRLGAMAKRLGAPEPTKTTLAQRRAAMSASLSGAVTKR